MNGVVNCPDCDGTGVDALVSHDNGVVNCPDCGEIAADELREGERLAEG